MSFDKGGDGLAFHSAIRWGKPTAELESFLTKQASLANDSDPKNGNKVRTHV
jgi:hypothetical protein